VTRRAWLVLGVAFFAVVGTANAGGYRFGVSDQAFYVPAIALRADPALFPRDREVFEPQMRLWLGDELIGGFVRMTNIELPILFAGLQLVTLTGLAVGAVFLARGLGCNWWTVALCLVLLTLRHRIAKTGANSLEGYMHPRMLAFACGLVALGFTVRLQHARAVIWTIVGAVVHTSTALWFAGVVLVAAAWPSRHTRRVRRLAAIVKSASIVALVVLVFSGLLPTMDEEWLAVIGDRDYLFATDWPLYAWIVNLAYPVVLLVIASRRTSTHDSVAGEDGLSMGLLALVYVFLITALLAGLHIAFFVQLQSNRVFWLLDAVVAIYLSWWIMEDLMARRSAAVRAVVILVFASLAIGRGVYVLQETGRPLVRLSLPAGEDWMGAMRWLREQSVPLHVLADPAHAWKYGVSVRVAALRDTPLEAGKDPAMAMYDRGLAARVADRTLAFRDFDTWTIDDVRAVAARYDLDVFVDRTDRRFDLPVRFRNDSFVIYDLR
jgi:hypothetical protein